MQENQIHKPALEFLLFFHILNPFPHWIHGTTSPHPMLENFWVLSQPVMPSPGDSPHIYQPILATLCTQQPQNFPPEPT